MMQKAMKLNNGFDMTMNIKQKEQHPLEMLLLCILF